jgi:hypothetical protein
VKNNSDLKCEPWTERIAIYPPRKDE